MSELDLIGKRVVIALGGNALGTNPKELTKKVEATAHQIALMIKEGINVVVTHGNGPQVGVIDEAFTIASKDDPDTIPFVPLQDCNAMSQGYIGAQLTVALMNELKNQNIMRSVTEWSRMLLSMRTAPLQLQHSRSACTFRHEQPGGPRIHQARAVRSRFDATES
jgi:carbamate kinase